ncbi:MAG: helix-turn-helix transcriptional regulator [Desulfobaccales bacterium]
MTQNLDGALESVPLERLSGDELLSLDQVAKILGVCKKTARARWSEGHFVFVKTGGSVRVWKSSVYAYLRRRTALDGYEHGILETTMKDFLEK